MHTSFPSLVTARLSTTRARVAREAIEHREVNWRTVALGAVVIAYADGFWITSLRGAVGAISANQNPFRGWLQSSTVMLPVIALVIVGALKLTRRWVLPSQRLRNQLAVAVLLCVAFTSVASIGHAAVTSWHDYGIQSKELAAMYSHTNAMSTPAVGGAETTNMNMPATHTPATHMPATNMPAMKMSTEPLSHTATNEAAVHSASCIGLCAARRVTRNTHVRAVGYISLLLLPTNLVLFLWIFALRNGQLWRSRTSKKNRDQS